MMWVSAITLLTNNWTIEMLFYSMFQAPAGFSARFMGEGVDMGWGVLNVVFNALIIVNHSGYFELPHYAYLLSLGTIQMRFRSKTTWSRNISIIWPASQHL
jgi:hypothetical protein